MYLSNKNNSLYFSDILFFLWSLVDFNTNDFLVTSDTTYTDPSGTKGTSPGYVHVSIVKNCECCRFLVK